MNYKFNLNLSITPQSFCWMYDWRWHRIFTYTWVYGFTEVVNSRVLRSQTNDTHFRKLKVAWTVEANKVSWVQKLKPFSLISNGQLLPAPTRRRPLSLSPSPSLSQTALSISIISSFHCFISLNQAYPTPHHYSLLLAPLTHATLSFKSNMSPFALN